MSTSEHSDWTRAESKDGRAAWADVARHLYVPDGTSPHGTPAVARPHFSVAVIGTGWKDRGQLSVLEGGHSINAFPRSEGTPWPRDGPLGACPRECSSHGHVWHLCVSGTQPEHTCPAAGGPLTCQDGNSTHPVCPQWARVACVALSCSASPAPGRWKPVL